MLGDRGSFVAKRRSRRRNCLHNYAPIKRAGYRRQERKGKTQTENRCRVADEGNSHLDSRAIKVRLRKPKKKDSLGKSGI